MGAQLAKEPAKCRGCGLILKGTAYCYGGHAYHPSTNKQCKVNHYGGYVCSYRCDYNSCLEMQNSFPGAGKVDRLLNREILNDWSDE